jgi:hypothetical protein
MSGASVSSSNFRLPTAPSTDSPVGSPPQPRIPQQKYPIGPSRYDSVVASMPQVPPLKSISPEIVINQIPSSPVAIEGRPKRKIVNAFGLANEGANEGAEIGPMKISRRELLPTDVEIDLYFCGICHSDIHHVYNEWKDSIYSKYDLKDILINISF